MSTTNTAANQASIQLTDTGNAKIFAKLHGQDVRFCWTSKEWLIWDGTRWVKDKTGEIQQRAKDAAIHLWQSAIKVQDMHRRNALCKHALKSQYEGRIRAMITLAQSEPGVPVTEADLDCNAWLLNVQNGTLDLKTGTLRPHQRQDLLTRIIPVSYDPNAVCPTWDKFLADIAAGDHDLIHFLQKSVGYSLTGSVSEQVFFILYGAGANGKSTFINTILHLLESYAQQTPTETLLVKKHTNAIPNDVARLSGARFVAAVEAEHGRHLAEALVKQLTGGDTITARYLHKEFFQFNPTFKIFLSVNHIPVIKGSDHGIWRRIRLIPFNVTIPEDKRDPDLITKLEAEFAGILRWAVEGCRLWQNEGLKPPHSVNTAVEEYRLEMDTIGEFIEECCVVDPTAKTPFGALFTEYGDWLARNGVNFANKKEFADALTEHNFPSSRSKGKRYRSGIRIK
jgi:putative DNA primase/helicase